MKRFWVSFWSDDVTKWEYHGPWWVSGMRDVDDTDEESICCAVVATDEEDAKRIVLEAHDSGFQPTEWRFVNEREGDWVPFCDRFPKAAWMKWPWPEGGASDPLLQTDDTLMAVECMCDFPDECGGLGVVHCNGCGGDLCVCLCGGEVDCDGCDMCDHIDHDDDLDIDPIDLELGRDPIEGDQR